MLRLALSLLLLLGLCDLQVVSAAACTSLPLPPLPTFPSAAYPLSLPANLVTGHWSEAVTLPRLPKVVPSSVQTECPHLGAGLVHWHDASTWSGGIVPAHGNNVVLPENAKVLISHCSISPETVFGQVTIPASSALVFDDAPINFRAKGILAMGNLLLGSETCRLRSKITITLHGKRSDQPLPAAAWVKGINVTGSIEVHGVQYTPTWTRLAATASPGNTWILIQDCPNWQPGQTIVVTSTDLKDSRDWHQNEEMTISSMATTTNPKVCAVNLTQPLQFLHYGGSEYQAEVSLLSRNIVIQGDETDSEPTDVAEPTVCKDLDSDSTYPCPNKFLTGFGAHVIINGKATTGRFSGVEMFRVGQTNVLGRYPIHYHMLKNLTLTSPNRFFVKDSSVHRSYFRCLAIHGTYSEDVATGVVLQENTVYDAIGHCYFIEDGVEEGHSILYNQGALVHPLGPFYEASQKLYYGQSTTVQTFASQDQLWYHEDPATLVLPSDLSASVFYFTNSYNKIVGNAASGGANGFAFPTLTRPVKLHETMPEFTRLCPRNRPVIRFYGNSAHSTGFWQEFSAGVYIGGELKHSSPGGLLTYNAGRETNRDTCLDRSYGSANRTNGCPSNLLAWIRLEDTKVFLANRGIQHWGARSEIYRFEGSNLGLSMNVFGQVHIDQMLVECRNPNHIPKFFANCRSAPTTFTKTPKWNICNQRDWVYWNIFNGFQFYDTGQQHIITNSTLRHCRDNWEYCVYGTGGKCAARTGPFLLLTHSNQFVPAQMQATKNITYGPGVDSTNLYSYSTKLTSNQGNTIAGRLQSWYDADGSASRVFSNRPVMMGSVWAGNDWWRYNDQCVLQEEMWICPIREGLDSIASIYLETNIAEESKIGSTLCGNGQSYPCPFVANITHFGRPESNSFPLALNAKVTGPIIYERSGWFVRYPLGTPRSINITNIQVRGTDVLLLAIPYPPNTQFVIKGLAADSCVPKVNPKAWDPVCVHPFHSVGSVDEVRLAIGGDAYYFNGKVLYIRVIQRTGTFGANSSYQNPMQSLPVPNIFSRAGLSIVVPTYSSVGKLTQWQYKLSITATTCPAPKCAAQPLTTVPAALFLTGETPSPISRKPTLSPSHKPSMSPTRKPTTNKPTTRRPSSTPSRRPTVSKPSATPTRKPTTKMPSLSPTRRPTTLRPSVAPSPPTTTRSPTKFPTKRKKKKKQKKKKKRTG